MENNTQLDFIINDNKNRMRISSEIEKELDECRAFCFSVAFIKDSGLAILRPILLKLEKRNIPGVIITSTYLDFNEPKIFNELLQFKNIRVYVYQKDGFHPKGYIFDYGNHIHFIVGSANITQAALTIHTEWNVKMIVEKNSKIYAQIANEIHNQINSSIVLDEQWIEVYKKEYIPINLSKNKKETVRENIKPNYMQQKALSSLDELRKNKQNKALVISATGTGKTYLSAFDVLKVRPRKMLFIVHRENIARAAMKTFNKVIKNKSIGLFTGSKKDIQADYLFSTVQTIHKKEYLELFDPEEFDYIIIDEVHRAGADSYQDILKYFKPKFLLGMSATPERTDNFNIYELFDYNIAYEIRLQQAMEYDLVCPFHYYGISDLYVDGESISDKTQFNWLVDEKRVEHIIKNIKRYGHSGQRVKGLIFCSRKDEAKELSRLFNLRGYKTVALVGDDSEAVRIKAMDLLESHDSENYLDYIFTVDIFNEGIDIPSVNQVVMLRPTESHIVFVQQLGRGLRKHDDKDYVVVIDFIGNYEKNFQIPIALSGNLSYNKDFLRHFMLEGIKMLPGESTVSFDEISQKRIFEKIDQANFSQMKLIKESYFELKNKIGKIPTLMDFERYDSIDVLKVIQHPQTRSYHNFLKKYDHDYKVEFTEIEENYLEYITMKLASGKRVSELEAIKLCVEKNGNLMDYLKNRLQYDYNIQFNELSYTTIVNELTQNFATGTGKDTYKDAVFIENDLTISCQFKSLINNNLEFRKQILEILDLGIYRYKKDYSDHYLNSDLCLYQKYTYEDVCRLLNWEVNVVAQNIGGYKYDERTKTLPVFVNYDKEEGISDTINYHDHFIDPQTLICMSKSGEGINSKRVSYFKNSELNRTQIHLFIRKNTQDKNSKEFYYLGQTKIKDIRETVMEKNNKVICEIKHHLDVPVKKDIYDYLVNG